MDDRRAPGETILVDGRVWTGSGHAPAIAVRDGRVLGAGTIDQVRDLAGPGARVLDLEGRRVVPGLIDSHVHFLRAGLNWNDLVRWDGAATLGEALGRIERAGRMAPSGTWLRVLGSWHPGQFSERRGPTRGELDAAAPDHPVYVQLLYEEAVLNSRALSALGDVDPPGGVVERDASGEPTGVVRGPGAFQAVLGSIPPAARAAQRASTRAVMRDFNATGVTGVIDPGGIGVTPESYRALFDVWRAGEMTLRARLYVGPGVRGDEVAQARDWVRHVQPGFGDPWLRYVGMGEVLTYGCHDLEGVRPFDVSDEARGDLAEITRLLAAHDWNVHLHAVLEATIGTVLDVWQEVADEQGLGAGRYSLAHAEAISPGDLARVRDMGVGVAVQNRLMSRAADSAELWGDEVASSAPPLRDILSLGIPLGAGTDGTVVSPLNPWQCIWWMVTGETLDDAPARRERARLTVEEALRAYTAGSAWFSLEEDERGILRPGAPADLAVLDRDVFECPPAELRDVRSELTMVGGVVVWSAGALAGADGD